MRNEITVTVLIIAGVLLLMCALGWVVQGNNFFMYKVFAPAFEGARRDVFENTKSYRQGMIQELGNMYLEYNKSTATDSQKDAIADVVLHRTADFDLNQNDVPPYLRQWIEKVRADKAKSR